MIRITKQLFIALIFFSVLWQGNLAAQCPPGIPPAAPPAANITTSAMLCYGLPFTMTVSPANPNYLY
jgi:hypothetical protein